MGLCVSSGGNLLCVIVWRVVVFMSWVFVWPVVIISYGSLCGEWS